MAPESEKACLTHEPVKRHQSTLDRFCREACSCLPTVLSSTAFLRWKNHALRLAKRENISRRVHLRLPQTFLKKKN